MAVIACLVYGSFVAAVGSAPASSSQGVSAAFEPWAASFVSPSSGFVLGVAHCHLEVEGVQPHCPALVVTTSDGGSVWRQVSAPPTIIAPALIAGGVGPQVDGITFADPHDGWLFGPGLWATHDGGAHWRRVAVNEQVTDVVASGGWAYAMVYGIRTTVVLMRSPVGRDDWQPVNALAGTLGYPLLAASGAAAWIGVQPVTAKPSSAGPVVWRSVNDGSHWTRITPCGTGSLGGIAATSPTAVVMACSPPSEIVTSTDGGVHVHAGPWPVRPQIGPASLAAPLGQVKTVVLAGPIGRTPLPLTHYSWIARTTNDGRSWTRIQYNDHGAGWTGLRFVSSTVGVAMHGYPGGPVDQLERTTNAGATFTPVRF